MFEPLEPTKWLIAWGPRVSNVKVFFLKLQKKILKKIKFYIIITHNLKFKIKYTVKQDNSNVPEKNN